MNRPVRSRGLLQLRDSHAVSRDWVALADAETSLSPTYQQRRKRAFCAFNAWCLSTFEAECGRLACSSFLLACALRGFGLWLYAAGAPRHSWLTDASITLSEPGGPNGEPCLGLRGKSTTLGPKLS